MSGLSDENQALYDRTLIARPEDENVVTLWWGDLSLLLDTAREEGQPNVWKAGFELAERALDYVGWNNGTFRADMDSDVAIRDLAFGVYDACGVQRPQKGTRARVRPLPTPTKEGEAQ